MRPWSSLSGSLAFCGISAAIGKSLPDLRAWQDVARWVTIHRLALAKEVGWASGVLGVFLKAQVQSVPSFQPLDLDLDPTHGMHCFARRWAANRSKTFAEAKALVGKS